MKFNTREKMYEGSFEEIRHAIVLDGKDKGMYTLEEALDYVDLLETWVSECEDVSKIDLIMDWDEVDNG